MIKDPKTIHFWLFATFILCAVVVGIEFLTDAKKIVMIPYGIVIPISVLVPTLAFHLNRKSINTVSSKWLSTINFLIFLVILSNAPLSLFLHENGYQYDRFLHTLVPFLFFIVGTLFLIPSKIFETNKLVFHKNAYDNFLHIIFLFPILIILRGLTLIIKQFKILKQKKSQIFFIVFSMIFIGLFLWEFTEYSIDIVFKTTIFGDFVQDIGVDFWEDIYFGFMGMIIAFFPMYYLYNKISEKLDISLE